MNHFKCDKCGILTNDLCSFVRCSSSTIQGVEFKLCQKCSLEAQHLLLKWANCTHNHLLGDKK